MSRTLKRKHSDNLQKITVKGVDFEPSRKRLNKFQLPLPQRRTESGWVYVCGQGDFGQLGLGDDASQTERKKLTPLPNLKNIVDIRAGGLHTLILTEDGIIYSFGCNDEGALGRITTDDDEFEPKPIKLPGKAVKLSAGDSHSACLLEDGSVYAWGSFRSSHGNIGFSVNGNERLPVQLLENKHCCDIASGSDHLVILTCSGRLYTLGCGEQGQLGRVSLRSASGESRRSRKYLLHPMEVFFKRLQPIDAIWATNYCTFIRESGTGNVLAFGLNNYKQLGLNTEDSNRINLPFITNFTDVKEISGGQHHTMVLKNDGTLFVIGRKDYGRLGLSNVESDVTELSQVNAISHLKIKSICGGEAQSFAITDSGEIWAWGMGSSYQLGTGFEEDEILPAQLSTKSLGHVVKASAGGQHTVCLIRKTESDITAVNSTKKIDTEKTSKVEPEIKQIPNSKNVNSNHIN